jgi:hypothetical protein
MPLPITRTAGRFLAQHAHLELAAAMSIGMIVRSRHGKVILYFSTLLRGELQFRLSLPASASPRFNQNELFV